MYNPGSERNAFVVDTRSQNKRHQNFGQRRAHRLFNPLAIEPLALHLLGLQLISFFEYYSDEFAPFYEKNFKYLIDFNNRILEMILDLLGMKNKSVYTTNAYQKTIEDAIDFRDIITPKKDYLSADPMFILEPYTQTFDEKMEFVPNLSIVDLLCNKGPEALSYLQRTLK